ncbi:MAG: ADP-glyceromanno-heptose 6-epimerase [Ignavibacteria bacterium]|nr:ADP-glyceromanno-heptose 6-epimerase [Ignavibacteria bacterium]
MKIITGGSGFIGSAICWKLNLSGVTDILIVDNDISDEKYNNIRGLRYKDFINKDDFIKDVVRNRIRYKVDEIYHMGACSSTTEDDMDFLIENNVEYSKSLAKWCLLNGVKFIYASSAATYGDGSAGFSDDEEIIPLLKPLNKYGLSKQLFDLWVYENKYYRKFVGLKYFNVFGPNENHKKDMRSMVNKAYEQIVQTGKLKLFKSENPNYKDGEQLRDFIYIKDAVDITVFFGTGERGENATGIYNAGSGRASTWLELAAAVFRAMDMPLNIEFTDIPDNIRNQYQYYSKADITRIRNTGYTKEFTGLDDAVRDYVCNYLRSGRYLSV